MSKIQQPQALEGAFTTALFMRIGLDRYTVGDSVLGPVFVGWTMRGVSAVRLAGTADAQTRFTQWYRDRIGRRVVRAVELDPLAASALAKLRNVACDTLTFDLESATPLERAVLARVAAIPSGYARPCELIAGEITEPCAVQAVADVLANNAVPLLIPCHRVVYPDHCCSQDYVFGSAAQERLLASEGLDPVAIDRVIERGFRYIAHNDEYFCLPTCGDIAARIDRPGYAGLRSLADAYARGLRACDSCRPAAA